ncbi:MAG: hypothetical protein ACM3PZ_02595 [Bacillota bacterium]
MKTNVVAYFPGDTSMIFALAAFLKAGYCLHPAWRMRDLWGIEARKICLLDFDGKEKNFPDLEIFICANAWKIELKTSLHRLYSQEYSNQNNPLAIKLRKIIFTDGSLTKNVTAIKADVPPSEPEMMRYYFALKAARIKAANTEDEGFYTRTLESIAREIASGSSYSDIDLLANFCQRVDMATEAAFEKINTNQDLFNIPGRPVAYGYLSNISPWLDLPVLKLQAQKSFPYLCILQYRKKDRELTWIGTNSVLDLELFFDLPCQGKNELLIEGSHRQVTKLLKSKIIEITT